MPKSHVFAVKPFQASLLDWYAQHRRVLPWRALPGQTPDPYHVWLSEIMLQQTTVQAVIAYFQKFISLWPTVQDLAQADPDKVMHAWAGLGYYARARNLLKCAKAVCEEHGGIFPQTEPELQKLPGIGPYTSAAIAAIAFDRQATVVDGNVDRVVSRVFKIETPLPQSKPEIREKAHIVFQNVAHPGDFAQALMDLGAGICIPQTPRCVLCPVSEFCEARKAGIQAQLPARAPKKPRPQRTGQVFWLKTKDNQIVLEKRAATRMLGGMPGLPTTDWDAAGEAYIPSPSIRKRARSSGVVYHTFTHFDLALEIIEADIEVSELGAVDDFMFIRQSDIKEVGFPTLFRKVVKLKNGKMV